jgi:hypothetical protein
MVAIAENSTLSALLPIIATTAAVPVAMIVVGAGITLSSVVYALYQHHQGASAQTVSALNLDFSPFLWEIEVWNQVKIVIADAVVENGDPPPRGKREAISLSFTRLDIQFSRFCTQNLSAARSTRQTARKLIPNLRRRCRMD